MSKDDTNNVILVKPELDYDKLEIPQKEEDIQYSDPQEITVDIDKIRKDLSSQSKQGVNYSLPTQIP